MITTEDWVKGSNLTNLQINIGEKNEFQRDLIIAIQI